MGARLVPLQSSAVAAGLLLAGCGCDQSACVSAEFADFQIAGLSQAQLADTSVTACRNDDCRTALLAPLQGAAVSPHALLLPSTPLAERTGTLGPSTTSHAAPASGRAHQYSLAEA